MHKWYWCPSIEKGIEVDRRCFGFRAFAFGIIIYLGKREWIIRVCVRR